MYLLDTNVVSEARKGGAANAGVTAFLRQCAEQDARIWLSVVTVGELRRGVDLIRHRGDLPQARRLEFWLEDVLRDYSDCILPFDLDAAQVWGRLRAPWPENALDKQIAAIALIHDLTVVTRNSSDFAHTGVRLFNPFT
ncbi:MAG: type II toxin-antitoxin system VapC family toxin [Betaproteobacteria bacterium]|nr:type II toxin-antitoxin system VapC family toxin [Betaproteobacteria bacterium]MCL2885837.1 type II toxin-antitoxin system VapC family toxin [Betaproteobacteria bacterium]